MAKVKSVAEFNPSNSYKWDPKDIFEITGQQFASFYHLLNREMNEVGGAPLALKAEAFGVMMDIFKSAVASGIVVEADLSDTPEQVGGKVKKMFSPNKLS